jgi:hypothetical protein
MNLLARDFYMYIGGVSVQTQVLAYRLHGGGVSVVQHNAFYGRLQRVADASGANACHEVHDMQTSFL